MGVVLCVVPAGVAPYDAVWAVTGRRSHYMEDWGQPRDHVSYVVKVRYKRYWPLVKHLERE